MSQIDAVLIVSFGGPEGPADVMPFLRNVTAGRDVPEERLAAVARRYLDVGGKSPINSESKAFIDALRVELHAHGIDLPLYWGNRNWHPLLADTVERMASDGIEHALAFVTSAYSSYSSCRQYREDIESAISRAGASCPRIDKIRQFFNHPGFIGPMVTATEDALHKLPSERRDAARLIFTAHSLPMAMAGAGRYESQLLEASRLTVEHLSEAPTFDDRWELVYQSRSGPWSVAWLEPDIVDHLHVLHGKGVSDVVIVPIGFVVDHMEVVYDLDTAAREVAKALGIHVERATTVGSSPRFVTGVRELIQERLDPTVTEPLYMGTFGPVGCLEGACCLSDGIA